MNEHVDYFHGKEYTVTINMTYDFNLDHGLDILLISNPTRKENLRSARILLAAEEYKSTNNRLTWQTRMTDK